MDEKLQAVAEQLAILTIHAIPKDNISYQIKISVGKCFPIDFTTALWDSDGDKILKSYCVLFNDCDTDLAITKKMIEITNIINGEINPFEEGK